ncbi:MAG: ABC transporter ATP-binding protein [Ktedonobacteraceae bacterium]|nr:ABC transporter ATP-binding protein [Ktedonobacteraceae bacterium]
MSSLVISVENLSKRYVIGHKLSGDDGMRHRMEAAIRAPLAWVRNGGRRRAKSSEDFWALEDVSFDVMQGEVVGIVGRNGAGKSTLLKLLSRITEPTSGRIRLRGRVASLLEVGTGFHNELTGRENIFLNGAILGMSRAEILARFDEIVAFSEIKTFLDTPVKRYSSGMYVRLAFAVAAHLESEILIVDEVLAVGDASFQQKCLRKMSDVAGSGRTVLFVSHNMEAVRTLCQRGLFLDDGKIQADGAADSIVEAYFAEHAKGFGRQKRGGYARIIQRIALKNDSNQETRQFRPGEDLIVEIAYDTEKRIDKPYFQIVIQSSRGNCFTASMLLDGHRPGAIEGKGIIACRFKSIPLLPQRYTVRMAIKANDGKEFLMNYEDVGSFNVTANLEDYGYAGEFLTRVSEATAVVIPYEWHLPDGTVASVSLSAPIAAISE